MPKLFNLIPSQYTTFSKVITTLDPIVPEVSGGALIPASKISVTLVKLRWEVSWRYNTSEGTSSIDIGQSTVEVRLTFGEGKLPNGTKVSASGIPSYAYEISGFPAPFTPLNHRVDWKRVSNTVFELVMPLIEFDPKFEANAKYVVNKKITQLDGGINYGKGAKTFKLQGVPGGIVPGTTFIQIRSNATASGKPRLGTGAKASSIKINGADSTITSVFGAKAKFRSNGHYLHYENYTWTKGIKWSNALLDPSGGTSKTVADIDGNEKPLSNNAKGYYYSAPAFSPITSQYDFEGSSTVKTELLNATVLEALVWENEVRDFVYFFISDTFDQASPNWYYFDNTDNNGGINAAVGNTKISARTGGRGLLSLKSGNSGDNRALNSPPAAPQYVTDTGGNPSYPPSQLRARAQFYTIDKQNVKSTDPQPRIAYSIAIRFAIARYTKSGSSWNGVWLGSDNLIKNVLSLPEAAEA